MATPLRQLRLVTREAARKSLARMIRNFDRDLTPDVQKFKAVVHAFSVLLQFDRVAEELNLEDRIY